MKSLLVVEDDTDVRAYLAEVLRSLNYRVTTVPNTQAALDVLQQNGRVDLLLTDIVMPGGNGRELAKQAAITRCRSLIARTKRLQGNVRTKGIWSGKVQQSLREKW